MIEYFELGGGGGGGGGGDSNPINPRNNLVWPHYIALLHCLDYWYYCTT